MTLAISLTSGDTSTTASGQSKHWRNSGHCGARPKMTAPPAAPSKNRDATTSSPAAFLALDDVATFAGLNAMKYRVRLMKLAISNRCSLQSLTSELVLDRESYR